jgi:hypothetical protein
MSRTVGVYDLATTDWRVEVDKTAVANYTFYNLTKAVSFGEMNSILLETVQLLSILIGFAGAVINLVVFVTLCAFKEFHKNTTSLLIINQTLIDAIASLAMTVTMIIHRTGASDYAVGFNRRLLCYLFDNSSFIGATMNASAFSLLLIALERYVKVVHPVKHRNNFRPWMVKLGVIAPWIDGLVVVLMPAWLTSDVVDGVCSIALAKSFAGKPYFAFLFVWHDMVPFFMFILCYSKILSVVRRQNRIFAEKHQPSIVTAGPSSDWAENNVHATNDFHMRGATEGADANKVSGRGLMTQEEKKVILTMLTITVCCIICWFPLDLFLIFYGYLPQSVATTGSLVLTVLAYMYVLLNAVIYSLRLGTFTRMWVSLRRLAGVIVKLL